MSEETTYNYFDTAYRTGVSRWGGRSNKNPEDVPATVDIQSVAAKNSNLRRCVDSLNSRRNPISTPNSTMRSSYVPHMARNRALGPTFSNRIPTVPNPPQAPNEELLRPSTEYRNRYIKTKAEPFVSYDTMERCSTATATRTRSIGSQNAQSPAWDTTYRINHCTEMPKTRMSSAVTFHSHTHLR